MLGMKGQGYVPNGEVHQAKLSRICLFHGCVSRKYVCFFNSCQGWFQWCVAWNYVNDVLHENTSTMRCMILCQRCLAWNYVNDVLHDIMSTMCCLKIRQRCVALWYVNDGLHGIMSIMCCMKLRQRCVAWKYVNNVFHSWYYIRSGCSSIAWTKKKGCLIRTHELITPFEGF